MQAEEKRIKVSLVKSLIGRRRSHRETVRALGLRRIGSSVVVVDTPCIRGMINKVVYLLKCEDC